MSFYLQLYGLMLVDDMRIHGFSVFKWVIHYSKTNNYCFKLKYWANVEVVNADNLNITYHIGKTRSVFHGGTYNAGKIPGDFHSGTYHVGKNSANAGRGLQPRPKCLKKT